MTIRDSTTHRTPVDDSPPLTDRRPGNREIWPVPPVPFTPDHRVDVPALDALVDFYADAAVDGLFVLAYSGEAFELDQQEQIDVCRQVIRRAAGRLRVVAAGNFRGSIYEQLEQLKRVADVGPEAVIVFLSTLPNAARPVDDLLWIASRIDAQLGVYECPVPEHRLLSADDVAALAATGRFVFMKETSRDRGSYRAKLNAAQGSPLRVHQANWGQLPLTLADGCPGFCGIVANVFPELCRDYCNSTELTAGSRAVLHNALASVLKSITTRHYPASMKYVLQKRGLPLGTVSRMNGSTDVDASDKQRLDDELEMLSILCPPSEFVAAIADRTHALLRGPHLPSRNAAHASETGGYFDVD